MVLPYVRQGKARHDILYDCGEKKNYEESFSRSGESENLR